MYRFYRYSAICHLLNEIRGSVITCYNYIYNVVDIIKLERKTIELSYQNEYNQGGLSPVFNNCSILYMRVFLLTIIVHYYS